MDHDALNRISSDSGTSSYECEMERAPERPPRGIRTSCGKSIVHMRLMQFERLCQENREEPRCSKSPRQPKKEIPVAQEEPEEDENLPPEVSHQIDEEQAEAEAKCDSNLNVGQSTDNAPTHPTQCDSRYTNSA